MISEFFVGKYYKWYNPENKDNPQEENWNSLMDIVFEEKSMKVLSKEDKFTVTFDKIGRPFYFGDCTEFFIECDKNGIMILPKTLTKETADEIMQKGLKTWVKESYKKEKDKKRKQLLLSYLNCILPDNVDKQIRSLIIGIVNRHKFEEWGIYEHFEKGLSNSILLYGKPGCGKTMIAESIAGILDLDLVIVGSADIQSNIPGRTEKNIRKIFNTSKDKVVLLDECDSILADRNNVGTIMASEINELLVQLERFEGICILTTNRLHSLDQALQRRILFKVEVPPPTKEARVEIWKKLIPKKMPIIDFDPMLLSQSEMTGGEIKNAILGAARLAILENKEKVELTHFMESIQSELKAKTEYAKTRAKPIHDFRGKNFKI